MDSAFLHQLMGLNGWLVLCIFFAIANGQIFHNLIRQYKNTNGLLLMEDVYNGNLPLRKEYDFIVIGAGPAGSVVASRLSEDRNISVLLLEAGPEENTYTDAPALSTLLLFSEYNWKYRTLYRERLCGAMKDKMCPWPAGKGLGGGTLINGMIYTRGNRKDFDKWANAGNTGWGYDDVLKYFKKFENLEIEEYKNEHFRGTSGPITISYPPYKSGLLDFFLKSGEESGYKILDYNGANHTGFSRVQSTMVKGRRCSAAKGYLRAASQRHLHIAQKSLVTKIAIDPDSKTAVGVEFIKKDKKRFVKARNEIILSAGAFNSPQILMLSGIGPAEHLKEMGIDVIADLPVGNNLQEHFGTTSLTFTLDQRIVPDYQRELLVLPLRLMEWASTGNTVLSNAGCEGLAYLKSTYAEEGDNPDIELIQISASYASDGGNILRKNYDITDEVYNKVYKELEGKPTFSIWVMGMYPYSKGTVRLKDKNPYSSPNIDSNFLNDTRDLDVVIQGIKSAIKLTETPAMQLIGAKLHSKKIPNCETYKFGSDIYWECFLRELTSQFHHQCGTCKMGPAGDPTAVVDPRLKVYGINNLRVVDASIMPTIPGGHTMAPSYMIGEKAADMIKEDYYLF